MVSEAEIDRLRLEADTIMTRYQQVEQALQRARNESGAHWETGQLTVTLDTPSGESIEITLDLDESPAINAQSRYDRAAGLEAELERQRRVVDRVAQLPADPVAYLICYHLDAVEGNYPRSMSGHLDAERHHVERLCEEMEQEGVLERVESGTVKQRRVKAKQADEVRQHHTYYRLSRKGDHLLRFLDEPDGQLNVLRHLPDGHRLVQRIARTGPDSPRTAAEELDTEFEYVRHLYRALRQVGIVTEFEGDSKTIDGSDHDSDSSGDRGRNHTYYAVTARGTELLQRIED